MAKTVRLLNVGEIQNSSGTVNQLIPNIAEGHSKSASYTYGLGGRHRSLTVKSFMNFVAPIYSHSSSSQHTSHSTGINIGNGFWAAVATNGDISIAEGWHQHSVWVDGSDMKWSVFNKVKLDGPNTATATGFPTDGSLQQSAATSDGNIMLQLGGTLYTNEWKNTDSTGTEPQPLTPYNHTSIKKRSFDGNHQASSYGSLARGAYHQTTSSSDGSHALVRCVDIYNLQSSFWVDKKSFSSNANAAAVSNISYAGMSNSDLQSLYGKDASDGYSFYMGTGGSGMGDSLIEYSFSSHATTFHDHPDGYMGTNYYINSWSYSCDGHNLYMSETSTTDSGSTVQRKCYKKNLSSMAIGADWGGVNHDGRQMCMIAA